MRILCVAEKPSIARAVSQAMCGGHSRTRDFKKGSKFVRNTDYTFDFPQYGRCEVTMTAVAGHLANIDFPDGFGWGQCMPVNLFDAPTTVKIGNEVIAKNIVNEARTADLLMIWTDCDREGEYIGYEIVEQARKGNPRITLENTLRARFSHLERAHVLHAAKNPIRLDQRAIRAVQARMEVDLRTGASLTRFLTDLFRPCLPEKTMISYGGCQFPTLGFVVDRYKRIKLFKKEPFWYLGVTFKKGQKHCEVTWERAHLFDRLIADCIYQRCLEIDPEEATVRNVETKPTSNWAPLPLTTVEMQKDCARFFKLTAKDTLAAAETLYTKGFISYPRTETDTFPKAMDLKKLIEKQVQSPRWGQYAQGLLDGKYRDPRQGKHSDEAHPPIHPVIFAGDNGSLSPAQRNVYEYVVRRFLACCSADAKGSKTTIRLQWGTEFFKTSGLVVQENNYLDVFIYSKWKSSAKSLPDVAPNERVKLVKAELLEGQTAPPKMLTETELIALMDANGIGTDATIADHIDKIKTRNYVTTQKVAGEGRGKNEVIVPTELGYGLVEGFSQIGFDNISLTKPFLRRRLEEQLTDICEGRISQDEVLEKILEMYREAYSTVARNKRVITDSYNRTVQQNA